MEVMVCNQPSQYPTSARLEEAELVGACHSLCGISVWKLCSLSKGSEHLTSMASITVLKIKIIYLYHCRLNQMTMIRCIIMAKTVISSAITTNLSLSRSLLYSENVVVV